MSETLKSYRSVPMCPVDAMSAAASYVSREWGESRRIGYAGVTDPVNGTNVYVFQCMAGDGARWLVWADKFGNVGTFPDALEATVALALDVEVC